MTRATAPVAAEIMAGRPPTKAITMAMVQAANRPTLGSTPAITEKEIASGIRARPTTRPARASVRNTAGDSQTGRPGRRGSPAGRGGRRARKWARGGTCLCSGAPRRRDAGDGHGGPDGGPRSARVRGPEVFGAVRRGEGGGPLSARPGRCQGRYVTAGRRRRRASSARARVSPRLGTVRRERRRPRNGGGGPRAGPVLTARGNLTARRRSGHTPTEGVGSTPERAPPPRGLCPLDPREGVGATPPATGNAAERGGAGPGGGACLRCGVRPW